MLPNHASVVDEAFVRHQILSGNVPEKTSVFLEEVLDKFVGGNTSMRRFSYTTFGHSWWSDRRLPSLRQGESIVLATVAKRYDNKLGRFVAKERDGLTVHPFTSNQTPSRKDKEFLDIHLGVDDEYFEVEKSKQIGPWAEKGCQESAELMHDLPEYLKVQQEYMLQRLCVVHREVCENSEDGFVLGPHPLSLGFAQTRLLSDDLFHSSGVSKEIKDLCKWRRRPDSELQKKVWLVGLDSFNNKNAPLAILPDVYAALKAAGAGAASKAVQVDVALKAAEAEAALKAAAARAAVGPAAENKLNCVCALVVIPIPRQAKRDDVNSNNSVERPYRDYGDGTSRELSDDELRNEYAARVYGISVNVCHSIDPEECPKPQVAQTYPIWVPKEDTHDLKKYMIELPWEDEELKGKTYLSDALGHARCQSFISLSFLWSVMELANSLKALASGTAVIESMERAKLGALFREETKNPPGHASAAPVAH